VIAWRPEALGETFVEEGVITRLGTDGYGVVLLRLPVQSIVSFPLTSWRAGTENTRPATGMRVTVVFRCERPGHLELIEIRPRDIPKEFFVEKPVPTWEPLRATAAGGIGFGLVGLPLQVDFRAELGWRAWEGLIHGPTAGGQVRGLELVEHALHRFAKTINLSALDVGYSRAHVWDPPLWNIQVTGLPSWVYPSYLASGPVGVTFLRKSFAAFVDEIDRVWREKPGVSTRYVRLG
jgi:hypothetical protein